jgi:hypothetical protein
MNLTGLKGNTLYYNKLSTMTEEECSAGNTTSCQSGGVFRQAAYEQRRRDRLHSDITTELQIQRETLATALPGSKINGFIHSIGIFPFQVSFYLEGQLKAYIAKCISRDECVLHFDATGSIIQNIKGQKMPYYYCLLMAGHNLPVLEFISASHTIDSIRAQLESWIGHVRLMNNGQTVKPKYIVTDFSFALIQASIQAFNQYSLSGYLIETFQVLKNGMSVAKMKDLTVLSICVAHMLKCVSMRLMKVEKDASKRKFMLVSFAALQRCTDLISAAAYYRNLFVVLCSRRTSTFVENCHTELTSMLTDVSDVSENDFSDIEPKNEDGESENIDQQIGDFDDKLTGLSTQTAKSLRDFSPFTTFFASIVADVDCEWPKIGLDNIMYSPQSFEVIKNLIHLYPIWSAALQSNVSRFASDFVDEREVPSERLPLCRSNALVESHF